jgi:phage gp16-like protein
MATDARRRDLASIHIAKKATDIDDAIYRAKLQEIGGVSSAADLDQAGRAQLLSYFKSIGWQPTGTKGTGTAKRPKRPTPAVEVAAQCRKVRAQLISLGRLPDTYADAIAKKSFGVDFYEWLTPEQLHKLTAMLAIEQKRKGAATGPGRV